MVTHSHTGINIESLTVKVQVQLFYLQIIKISQVGITFCWRQCKRPFCHLGQSPPPHRIQLHYSPIYVHTKVTNNAATFQYQI